MTVFLADPSEDGFQGVCRAVYGQHLLAVCVVEQIRPESRVVLGLELGIVPDRLGQLDHQVL